MKATGAMTRNVVCVGPDDSLVDAHEIMVEWEIRHLPVLVGDVLVGILSDRDVLKKATEDEDGELEVPAIPVSAAMTPDPITCSLFTDVSRVARTMIDNKIDSVPVLDEGGALAGLLTSSDLLQMYITSESEPEVRLLPFQWQVHSRVRPGMVKA